MKLLFLLGSACLLLSSCNKTETEWTMYSPSKNLKFVVNNKKTEGSGVDKLEYTVSYIDDGKEIVALEPSPLGIVRADNDFSENLIFSSSSPVTIIDESYTMVSGKQLQNRNFANESTLTFRNENQANIELIIRVYDEGFAYRYNFPDQLTDVVRLENELSGFNLPDPGEAWMHEYDTIAPWAPGYETFYQSVPIGTKASDIKNGWAFPLLFHVNELWIMISEADLDENYCGMHLNGDPFNGLYTLRLPEKIEAYDTTGQKPESVLPWKTPWRFGLVSKDPGDIVESNMVYHLARPSEISNTDWIEPGVSSWSWWSEGSSPRDFNKLKSFVDLASEMGWKYSLVDAGWEKMEGGNLSDLASYARSKGVGLLVWYNSGGPHNVVTASPRDLFFDSEIRKKEFKWLKEIGASGVKVDFFQSDKQNIIKLYLDILKDAADAEIVVNFHGCTLPRGWSRTWPNLLTMEAVRGGEAYRFDRKFPELSPAHHTIIPFTRNVVGPVDYTPLTYSDNRFPHITTFGHETALTIIFESGIQHLADHQKVYRNQPGFILDYLKQLPTVWDETRYLAGKPGEMVILARRSGTKWFIAGINGENSDKDIEIDISFIGDKSLKIISDGNQAREFTFRELNEGDKLEIKMLPFGGFVAYSF